MSTGIEYQNEIERRRIAADMGFMTEETVAYLSKSSPATVEDWRKKGIGPAYIRFGSAYFYEVTEVMAYMKSLKKVSQKTVKRAAK